MDKIEPATIIGVSLLVLGICYGAIFLKIIQRLGKNGNNNEDSAPCKPGSGKKNNLPPFLLSDLRQPAPARVHYIQAGGFPIGKPSNAAVNELIHFAAKNKKAMHNNYSRWNNGKYVN